MDEYASFSLQEPKKVNVKHISGLIILTLEYARPKKCRLVRYYYHFPVPHRGRPDCLAIVSKMIHCGVSAPDLLMEEYSRRLFVEDGHDRRTCLVSLLQRGHVEELEGCWILSA